MSGHVAFKCTPNDGSSNGIVGFRGTCTNEQLISNVKSRRVFCSNDGTPCRRYYDNNFMGKRPVKPCMESRLFEEWEFGAGYLRPGSQNEKPINMPNVEVGGICVLTTKPNGAPELQRRIFGLFEIGKISGEDETQNIVKASNKHQIYLPRDVREKLWFWRYYTTPSNEPVWKEYLHRSLADSSVHQLLIDIVSITDSGSNAHESVSKLLKEKFSGIPKRVDSILDRTDLPNPQSIMPKYGGGEGEDHRQLKYFVAENPECVDLPRDAMVSVEHTYLSGDRVDIAFKLPDGQYAVVEIETVTALPGAHQAIKYRSLLEAQLGILPKERKVHALLVAHIIDDETKEFCRKYNIRSVVLRAPPSWVPTKDWNSTPKPSWAPSSLEN